MIEEVISAMTPEGAETVTVTLLSGYTAEVSFDSFSWVFAHLTPIGLFIARPEYGTVYVPMTAVATVRFS